jgi:hypothetical protein
LRIERYKKGRKAECFDFAQHGRLKGRQETTGRMEVLSGEDGK